MPKEKSPPVNLDKYLEGRNHKYMTYEKASRLYGMPYWTFVSLAKEANATWKLRKTAMVDLVVLEKYLEETFIKNGIKGVSIKIFEKTMTDKYCNRLEELKKLEYTKSVFKEDVVKLLFDITY